MIAFLDVDYRKNGAIAAAVLAGNWTDSVPSAEVVVHVATQAEYVSGEFYLRELPCLLAVLERCQDAPEVVVVDGYVWLGPGRPGLGGMLFEALGRTVPVVGVAKSMFRSADQVAVSVIRGGSRQPLWVTAIGIEPSTAADAVRSMSGSHRIPTLLKRADRFARTAPAM